MGLVLQIIGGVRGIYHAWAQQAWEKYLDDNHVNMQIRDEMFEHINAWAEKQWTAHDGTPSQKKSESAMKLKDFGKSWVIHNEDHKATRTVAYCPSLYRRLLEETFSDDKIWKPEKVSPKAAVTHLQEMVPKGMTGREKTGKALLRLHPRTNEGPLFH